MNLSIVLPLRNQDDLKGFLARLYNPSSPDYRHFLSVDEFTARYGPTADDYQAVVAFARANGFTVTGTPSNRLVVPVSGTVDQINRAFNVRMNVYQHPTEQRTFFSPDREPSLDLIVPVAHISGLNNFSLPHPMVIPPQQGEAVPNVNGSGPSGWYLASDMRAAYYGATTLDGTGQAVGLLEFDGYYASDVAETFTGAGQTYNVPINNVLLDGATGLPANSNDEAEVVLDIVQAIGMAPGMSQVRVYIGNTSQGLDDANILNSIATENIAKQISSSWSWVPDDPSTDDTFFEEMAAQGQSFFVASGDDGAYDWSDSPYFYPAEDDYVTAVGGTDLITASAGGAWTSETAWVYSGGGPSPDAIAIPSWQSGLANSSNGGSATLRNVPDVAMESNFDNWLCTLGNCEGGWGGTSFAAPRWAGFMALVNQQAVENGNASTGGIGFLNPPLYTIGAGTDYSKDLHDITSGNNDSYNQPNWYAAVAGYDLVTGWGTANGANLINDLAGPQVPGFWLRASTPSLGIPPGSSGTTTINITDAGGFTGNVTLAAPSTLPTGVTASWGTNPASGSSVLTLTAASDAPNSSTNLTITGTASGTSGELTANTTIALTVHPQTFQLAATPSAVTVGANATTSSTILVTPEYGFTGNVSLSISGLPSGVTASFSPTSTSGSSTLTLTGSSSVTPGASTLTVTGTSGSLTVTTSITLTVQGPSFAIYGPTTLSIGQGASTSAYLYFYPEYGFTGNISLSVSGLPSGVTATFSSNPVSLSGGYDAISVLTLTARSSTAIGSSTVTITGTSGSITETATFVLGVFAPSFTLSGGGSISVGQGTSGLTSVYVEPVYGFNGNVSLSIAGMPTGVTALFTPNPTTNNSELTLAVARSAAVGSTTLTITGTSGSITATTKLTLNVLPPSFTLSGCCSITMGQATTASINFYIYPQYGFTGNVSFSVSGLPAGVTGSFSPNPVTLSNGAYYGDSTLNLNATGSAAVGNSTVTVSATSGGITQTTTFALSVNAPTFSLSAGGGVSLGQGTSSSTYVYVYGQYGFNGSVNLTASGLPGGVTASFNPSSTTGYSTLTLTASATAAFGSGTVTITGTSGSITQTTTISVGVYQPSFTFSGTGVVDIGQGSSGTSYYSVYSNYGFTGNVNLSVSGLPSGVTASFSTNPASLISNGSVNGTLTLTASSSAPVGQYSLTFTATSGAISQTTFVTLGIYASSFTVSTGSELVGQGTSTTAYVYLYTQYGFTGNVNLSVSGLPSGVTASFSQNPVTLVSGSYYAYTQLTLTTTSSAPPGQYNFTVTGTSGSLTASSTAYLTIYPPSFYVYASLYGVALNPGSSAIGTVTIESQYGFSGTVSLSASGLPSGVTASFSPNPSTSNSLLTLTAAPNIAPGNVSATITGVSGSLTASTTLSFTITTPSFSINAAPSAVDLAPGDSEYVNVAVVPQNGFAASVSLTASGVPSGVTASFSPNPVSGGDSILKLTAASSASPGSANVTITATSGSLTASAPLIINIRAPVTGTTTTTTTLSVSAAGNPVQSVASGTVVTLTAAVSAASAALKSGQINFCVATAPSCDSFHLIGTAQITSAGTAVIHFIPGMGARSYKAVFPGTNSLAPSASSATPLSVTATPPTVTTIAQSGSASDFTLTATVTGHGLAPPPTGTVSFLDVTNANATLATAALGNGTTTMGWANPQSPATGSAPQAIAVADFNGDGIPDLAIVNSSSDSVTILIGKGDGTFTASASPQTGSQPVAIAVGDFNGDGIPDLATANEDSTDLTILLGNGDGTFTVAPNTPPTGAYPQSIVAGDFNRDGIEDLAVLNGDTVVLLLGNGDGTFTPSPYSPVTNSSPFGLVAGDFNGDGILDLVTCNHTNNGPGSLTLLLGNGDGSFTVVPGPTVGDYPSQVVTGDFNRDGKLDLAVVNSADGSITILLGNGDGTFTAAPARLSGLSSQFVAVADFNGDGIPDLAVVSSSYYTPAILIYLGNGDGTFTAGTALASVNNPYAIAAADFNGDGLEDLAVGSGYNPSVSIDTAVVTQTATATASGVSPPFTGNQLVVASYPGDTNYQSSVSPATVLLSGTEATPTVTVSPSQSTITARQSLPVTIKVSGGNGNPTPTGSVVLSSGSYASSTAILSSGSASITIPAAILNYGANTLTATYTPDSASFSTYNAASGSTLVNVVYSALPCLSPNPNPNPDPAVFAAVEDFNGDCRSDILWRNSTSQQVYEWLMNGTTIASSGSPSTPTSDWVIQGTGDFNGDGYADILWRNTNSGEVYIWLMNGTTIASSGSPYTLADPTWVIQGVGDFDGDGKSDILWRNTTTGEVYIWLMNGTAIKSSGSPYTLADSTWVIQGVGDFDGDGKADILWRNTTTGQVVIWLMNGTTIKSNGSPYTLADSTWVIQGVGDFDGDGKSDILWRNTNSGEVFIWLMNGTAIASSGSPYTLADSTWVIQGTGDYDGSGRAGILWRNNTTGQVYIWLMNGTTIASSQSPGTLAAAWQIQP